MGASDFLLIYLVVLAGLIGLMWGGWKDAGFLSWAWVILRGSVFLTVFLLLLNMCGAMDSPTGYRGD